MSSPPAATLMKTAFEAVAAKDVDALEALWHRDLEDRFLALGQTLGRTEARTFFTELFQAFEPFVFTPVRIMDAGSSDGSDITVGQWRIEGTFSGGRWNGFEPTGGHIEMEGVDVMEWEEGLLRRNTVYMDGAALARQLGLLPAQGSRSERMMTGAFNAVQSVRRRLRR